MSEDTIRHVRALATLAKSGLVSREQMSVMLERFAVILDGGDPDLVGAHVSEITPTPPREPFSDLESKHETARDGSTLRTYERRGRTVERWETPGGRVWFNAKDADGVRKFGPGEAHQAELWLRAAPPRPEDLIDTTTNGDAAPTSIVALDGIEAMLRAQLPPELRDRPGRVEMVEIVPSVAMGTPETETPSDPDVTSRPSRP